MILFLTIGTAVWVGVLCCDIVNQPTISLITRIILFVLCGVILVSTTVVLRWDLIREGRRQLCQKMIKNRKVKKT